MAIEVDDRTVPPAPSSLEDYAHRQLGFFEALRRLGIPSDDIFVAFYNGGELFTTVKQPGRTFNASISEGVKVDHVAYLKVWKEVAAWWNARDDVERQKLWEKNRPPSVQLVVALKMKGFTIMTKDGDGE